jgi:DNA-binding winged helix-turn-helix (wHTH) protein/TolB-like protein
MKVQEQPLRVLCLLLERAGEIVTREELRQSLWPEGTFVEFDGNLNATLKRLRFALGDDADNPIFIETVPRRGYRFIAPVESERSANSDAGVAAATASPSQNTAKRAVSTSFRQPAMRWILAGIALILFVVTWRYLTQRRTVPVYARKVIAVLPFSNEGAGPEFDYLKYAIANDLATDLTSVPSVTVRPLSSISRFGSQLADPQAVGRELRVTHVVTGGFLLDKENLRVNLELVDVAQNQAVWREEVTVSAKELVPLHEKLAARTAQGLLPAMNISNASANEMPTPKNEEALDLFLHSLTIPLDPEPNQLAIKNLEKAVALDGGYAPAWGELGWRYYIDYHYGGGGEAAVGKALQAYKRQSALDPNMSPVSTTIRVEQGDLNGAYDQAADFLGRHPEISIAHYSMSYVLRYAGLLNEAGQQCDAALAIDPGFNVFRSCATPFFLKGEYARAQAYIQLDEHSGLAAMYRMLIALRNGNTAAASAESEAVSRTGSAVSNLIRSYLAHAGEAELKKAAMAVEADPKSARDAEELYRNAELLSLCGQRDAALRELAKAIQGNYCSYQAMEKDPLFDPIRPRAEFAELRKTALLCQRRFEEHRKAMR